MTMYYVAGEHAEPSKVSVDIGFDTSQFGDIELFGNLMQFKEAKKSFWQSIGIGGSICAKPVVRAGKIYFGCCDKKFYCLDKNTGEELWRFPVNGQIHDESGADFMGNTVYFLLQRWKPLCGKR